MNAGHIKTSRRLHATRGPQVPTLDVSNNTGFCDVGYYFKRYLFSQNNVSIALISIKCIFIYIIKFFFVIVFKCSSVC